MKISNDHNLISTIIITVLFSIGTLILLKIGIIQWLLWCNIIYFFVVKDDKFMDFMSPIPGNKFSEIYLMMWFMSMIVPVLFIITYLSSRLTGYSNPDDYDIND